jgi:hypothetical protein
MLFSNFGKGVELPQREDRTRGREKELRFGEAKGGNIFSGGALAR